MKTRALAFSTNFRRKFGDEDESRIGPPALTIIPRTVKAAESRLSRRFRVRDPPGGRTPLGASSRSFGEPSNLPSVRSHVCDLLLPSFCTSPSLLAFSSPRLPRFLLGLPLKPFVDTCASLSFKYNDQLCAGVLTSLRDRSGENTFIPCTRTEYDGVNEVGDSCHAVSGSDWTPLLNRVTDSG